MNGKEYVEKIKKEYPNPSKTGNVTTISRNFETAQYCVLGALSKYQAKKYGRNDKCRFGYPCASAMNTTLMQLNKSLSEEEADNFTAQISELNDAGKFEEAWIKLEEAIDHNNNKKEKEECQPQFSIQRSKLKKSKSSSIIL